MWWSIPSPTIKVIGFSSMAQLYVNDLPIRYGDVAIDGLLDMI
jgi:hypothetical protein